MRLTCPACCAEMSLEVAIGREADARAMAGYSYSVRAREVAAMVEPLLGRRG